MVIDFIRFFLESSWRFFTEINVPGFDFTYGTVLFGVFLALLPLRFLPLQFPAVELPHRPDIPVPFYTPGPFRISASRALDQR